MTIHVVQPGDTLWRISQRYNIPINTIMVVNGLQTSQLEPNLALYIPIPSLTMRLYDVRAGDSLWLLAAQFNTTIANILAANPGLTANLQIGQRINIPSPQPLSIRTLGFIVPYSVPRFLATFDSIAPHLNYLAVVSYSFTEEGFVYVDLPDDEVVARSRQRRVTPLLMIRNIITDGVFSPELAGRVLENPTLRNRLIRSLMHYVTTKGYGGVSIDFEFIPPPRRRDFVVFLRDLKTALGQRILHVNVHAKTVDIPHNPIIGAYDYAEIGRVADIVAVMTMDYGYPGGPPDPVAPIWWMEEVIRYAVGLINPRKLQTAFPLYGYDWTLPTNVTRGLSVLRAQNLAIETRATILFDTVAMAPNYFYWIGTETHRVWFEDIRSFQEKYKLLDVYRLLGTTYWQIDLPFPQNWAYMANHIQIS